MTRLTGLGIGLQPRVAADAGNRTEFLLLQRPLQRILAFTRRSIDDVVNDPIAKREVLGYTSSQADPARARHPRLKRQWNSVARAREGRPASRGLTVSAPQQRRRGVKQHDSHEAESARAR